MTVDPTRMIAAEKGKPGQIPGASVADSTGFPDILGVRYEIERQKNKTRFEVCWPEQLEKRYHLGCGES